jgi:hypothetical protein
MTDSQAIDSVTNELVEGRPAADATIGDSFPTRIAGYETHDVRDGIVVYRSEDDSVHHLNAMATLFYELADGRALSEIARSFATIFDLNATEATAAAESANRELVALRLVA